MTDRCETFCQKCGNGHDEDECPKCELRRIRAYAEAHDKMVRDHVGKTIIEREADGSPCWAGRSPMLWLFDVCDEVLHLRRMKAILEEHVDSVVPVSVRVLTAKATK